MKLILCSEGDVAARWAYTHLTSLGCADLELVTAGDLARATKWNHRVTSDGSTADIHLLDGRRIDFATVDGVINRLTWPSRALIGQATAEDQDYASAESFAFHLSCLHALPGRVFNRATTQGLCGAYRSQVQWALLAGQAGFEVAPIKDLQATSTPSAHPAVTIVLFEGKPFGPFACTPLAAACDTLFRLTQTSLLGLTLHRSPAEDRWIFATATPLPDLCEGGIPLLQAILHTWSSETVQ